ncbi:hypothetical protein [Bradyrhizobium tunisiense]|uniref:hypothetical protein n=1 Tax=Bradyrhizobium tunisiense TaxID=3278709 RepID=UPI0035DA934F
MKGRIRRRVQVEAGLYFEYEVAPHRAILARRTEISAKDLSEITSSPCQRGAHAIQGLECALPVRAPSVPTGMYIPFKQVRLKGQVNPLKPPLHVETVLIGRALGQQTGYLSGVGFRIRDDGYVEGEFAERAEKFTSFEIFREAVRCRLAKMSDPNSE